MTSNSYGWYGDTVSFPGSGRWFIRGGYNNQDSQAGVFAFEMYDGDYNINTSFRIVLFAP